jgi:hypothetical protein
VVAIAHVFSVLQIVVNLPVHSRTDSGSWRWQLLTGRCRVPRLEISSSWKDAVRKFPRFGSGGWDAVHLDRPFMRLKLFFELMGATGFDV